MNLQVGSDKSMLYRSSFFLVLFTLHYYRKLKSGLTGSFTVVRMNLVMLHGTGVIQSCGDSFVDRQVFLSLACRQ